MRSPTQTDAFEPIVRGVAQSGVRVANERAVLSLVAGVPGISNADLARRTGLGPQTTARILLDLESKNLIERGEVLRGRRGQPATPYWLNPHGAFAFGVEIGWSHLEIALLPMMGEPLARTRVAHAFPDADEVLPRITAEVDLMRSAMTDWQRERLIDVGIAVSSVLADHLDLLGASTRQARKWDETDIAQRVSRDTGLSAICFDEGSAATWTQIMASPPPRPAGFANFHIGTFISGGVVSEGMLWEGPSRHAGDLGAIIVADGKGAATPLRLLASIHALRARLEEAGMPAPPDLRDWEWPRLAPVVNRWIDDAGFALAQAAISASALMDIGLFTVDGLLPADCRARLIASTRSHLAQLPRPGSLLPEIMPGRVGASAPALGAGQRTLFNRYFSRAWTLFDS